MSLMKLNNLLFKRKFCFDMVEDIVYWIPLQLQDKGETLITVPEWKK